MFCDCIPIRALSCSGVKVETDAGVGVSLGRSVYLGSADFGGAREPAEGGGWKEGREAGREMVGSDGRAAGGLPVEKPGMNGRGAEGTGGGGEEPGGKVWSDALGGGEVGGKEEL